MMCCGGHPSPGAPIQPTPCLSPLAALPTSEVSLCDLDHVSMVHLKAPLTSVNQRHSQRSPEVFPQCSQIKPAITLQVCDV